MAELRIMGASAALKQLLRDLVPEDQITGGDTKVIWDPTNADEVSVARNTFKKLKEKNFQAYAVKKSGEKGELINEFDEDAGKIIMAAAMAGGA